IITPLLNPPEFRKCKGSAIRVLQETPCPASSSDATHCSHYVRGMSVAAVRATHTRGARMSDTVGDFLVKRLSEWGISRISGYPGDGISGITAALRSAGDQPRFIQARHEELAAFMACAHAKFTGEV